MTSGARCPGCGQENRPAARFCQECGAALDRRCPECDSPLDPTARFCDSCGHRLEPVREPAAAAGPRSYTAPHLAERILRDRRDLEGERRSVTVLFVDAVDSTAVAERLGEEAMYSVMQGCLAVMMEAVHHYEGHIASFTGDGMMAVFGAPIAHEESERRAVAAALRLQSALREHAAAVRAKHGVDCRFRVGLHTGPVVVGRVSDELAMEFTAIGDTVNLAARVEQLAEPGTVYLTETTHRAVADFFDCEAAGEQRVKGKSEAVSVYRAVREKPWRTRFQVAAERGLAPFVGREGDLGTLEHHLARARQGRGQVVIVSGEAGIGKSRLVLEFRRRATGAGVTWLEGHCISYGAQIPYLPLIEVVKGAFGISEDDDDRVVVERVEQGTSGWDEAGRATVPYLRYLLSVDPGDERVARMDPRERRAGVLDALRAVLAQSGGQGLLVVALEDLHWVDEASEHALAALVDAVRSMPVLLLGTTRPEYTELPSRSYVTRLALDPLDAEESAGLVRGVLGVSPPAEVERLVAEKAEGNPFYAEEVIRSLLDSGVLARSNGGYRLERAVEEIRIPGTVQEVVLSRIDRLDREAKGAIQLASVIGREFTRRLLQRISDLQSRLDEALGELKTLELIYEKSHFPELAYMFKHALTQDVAYSTLLSERRRSLHRVVAAAVEELYADRLAEQYEALAHHYYEGGDWEKALDYLVQAGDKAAAAFANEDALDYYARALEVCERMGDAGRDRLAELAQRRAFVNFTVGRFGDAITDLNRRLSVARTRGDRRLEGLSLAYRGVCELYNHDYNVAEATLRSALTLAEDERLEDVGVLASLFLGLTYKVTGRHAEADALLAFVAEHASGLDDAFARGLWGVLASRVELWAGRLDRAVQLSEEGRHTADRFVSHRLFNRWSEAHARATRGDYEEARRLLEGALATSERVGDVWVRGRCLNTMGYVYAEVGDLGRAMAWNQRGLEEARATPAPVPEVEMNAALNLAENLLAVGRLDEAEEQFRLVEAAVRDPRPGKDWMRWRYAERFFHSFGEYRLARGDADSALALATECLARAEHSGSRKNIVKARRLRGEALAAQGNLEEAGDELGLALELARLVGNPPQLWKTHVALGRLHEAAGRPDDGRAAFRDASRVIDDVASGLSDVDLRERFLASAHVASIRRAAGGRAS